MILSRNLSEAFNAQVNAEMWSSNLYLSMSVYFQKAGLNGFAHWMKKQAAEELEHAHKLIDYALDRGGDITIGQINVVPTGWGNPLEVFEHVYKHECYVSELIDKLVDIAEADKDHASRDFLFWSSFFSELTGGMEWFAWSVLFWPLLCSLQASTEKQRKKCTVFRPPKRT